VTTRDHKPPECDAGDDLQYALEFEHHDSILKCLWILKQSDDYSRPSNPLWLNVLSLFVLASVLAHPIVAQYSRKFPMQYGYLLVESTKLMRCILHLLVSSSIL
jgi:hypothetical protein